MRERGKSQQVCVRVCYVFVHVCVCACTSVRVRVRVCVCVCLWVLTASNCFAFHLPAHNFHFHRSYQRHKKVHERKTVFDEWIFNLRNKSEGVGLQMTLSTKEWDKKKKGVRNCYSWNRTQKDFLKQHKKKEGGGGFRLSRWILMFEITSGKLNSTISLRSTSLNWENTNKASTFCISCRLLWPVWVLNLISNLYRRRLDVKFCSGFKLQFSTEVGFI